MLGLRLSRYMIRLFSMFFLSFLGVVSLFAFLFDFSEIQRRALSKGSLTFFSKLELVVLKTPFLLEQLLPFLVFGSTLTLFWRLNRQHEMVVIRSFGLSVWQFSRPLCIFAVLIGVADLLLLQPFTAQLFQTYQEKNTQYFDSKSSEPAIKILPGGLWIQKQHQNQQLIFRIEKLFPKENKLEGVSLSFFSSNHEFQAQYQAASAQIQNHQLILLDGWKLSPGLGVQRFREKTLPVKLNVLDIEHSNPLPPTLSFNQLIHFISLLDRMGLSSHKYQMQLGVLIGRVIWLVAMVLFAASFSLRPIRQGKTWLYFLLGGIGCFVFYIIRDLTYALGVAGSLPIVLASQAPGVLTLLTAMVLLMHFEEGKV